MNISGDALRPYFPFLMRSGGQRGWYTPCFRRRITARVGALQLGASRRGESGMEPPRDMNARHARIHGSWVGGGEEPAIIADPGP